MDADFGDWCGGGNDGFEAYIDYQICSNYECAFTAVYCGVFVVYFQFKKITRKIYEYFVGEYFGGSGDWDYDFIVFEDFVWAFRVKYHATSASAYRCLLISWYNALN